MALVAVAGTAFPFNIALADLANSGKFKAAPTIAAGDFQISINDAAYVPLDNTPTVSPAGGKKLKVILSAAETTEAGAGGIIWFEASDTDDEWGDVTAEIRVVASANDIAMTGADGDTLEDISDQLDNVSSDVLSGVVENTYTVKEVLQLLSAAVLGKATGGGTTTIVFKGLDGTTSRVTATVDANGNRSAVILDAT